MSVSPASSQKFSASLLPGTEFPQQMLEEGGAGMEEEAGFQEAVRRVKGGLELGEERRGLRLNWQEAPSDFSAPSMV